MKNATLFFLLLMSANVMAQKASDSPVQFSSSDSLLEQGFRWAKQQALQYVRRKNDPVGDWYEAALPEREAFCMRDVAHQLTGANVLGLSGINKNLLKHFAASINVSRDWCGYWEIDKLNRPAPVDYRSDGDFWYNLPGSFDVLDACFRQYRWTGDTTFLFNGVFKNFYQRTTHDYVMKWDKNSDGIMEGASSPLRKDRGIGSYDESANGITGADLIAAQALAYKSYASLLRAEEKLQEADAFTAKADKLLLDFNKSWWDQKHASYYSFKTSDGWLHNDAMQLFLLRWDFIRKERIAPVLSSLLAAEPGMNVEMRSYFAREMFRYGYSDEARRLLKVITDYRLKRREYPEVSFGTLEAYTDGLMGIEVDAPNRTITTLSRVAEKDQATLSHLPIWSGNITVKHEGISKSVLTNETDQPISWIACFYSTRSEVTVNGKMARARITQDISRHNIISIKVEVLAGGSGSVALQ